MVMTLQEQERGHWVPRVAPMVAPSIGWGALACLFCLGIANQLILVAWFMTCTVLFSKRDLQIPSGSSPPLIIEGSCLTLQRAGWRR